MILVHIGPKIKTRQSQEKITLHAKHPLKLLDKMYMKWIERVLLKIQSGHDTVHRHRDVKPVLLPCKFKVKVMVNVKPDGNIRDLEFNRYVCFSLRGNRTIFGWDITNSIFDFENSRSRSQRKSTIIPINQVIYRSGAPILPKIKEIRKHYNDVTMGMIASQITSLTIVYSTVYSDADQRKHQSSGLLAFVWGIHRSPVNSPHKWPVTRKMFHLMTSSCLFETYRVNKSLRPVAANRQVQTSNGSWCIGIKG